MVGVKDYYVVSEMINTSGFGWNNSSNTISVANDVCEEYVRHIPKLKVCEESHTDTITIGLRSLERIEQPEISWNAQSRMKRSRLETISKEPIIVNLMEEFFKQQNQSIGTFVDKLDRRDEDSKNNKPINKTKLVLEALSKICSLTEENRLYFAYKIATDASVVDYSSISLKVNKSHW
ncbi:hypothetical protein OROMI_016827 [Orobanche minor]